MNKDGDLKQTLKEVKHLLLAWLFLPLGFLFTVASKHTVRTMRMLKSLLECHHGFFGESPYHGFVQ